MSESPNNDNCLILEIDRPQKGIKTKLYDSFPSCGNYYLTLGTGLDIIACKFWISLPNTGSGNNSAGIRN